MVSSVNITSRQLLKMFYIFTSFSTSVNVYAADMNFDNMFFQSSMTGVSIYSRRKDRILFIKYRLVSHGCLSRSVTIKTVPQFQPI